MSHSVFRSQWFAQLEAMRHRVSGLKLDGQYSGINEYGKGLVLDDEDLSWQHNTIWDLFSKREENEDIFVKGNKDPLPNQNEKQQVDHDLKWLRNRCIAFTTSKPGLDGQSLQKQISALLASDQNGATPIISHELIEH